MWQNTPVWTLAFDLLTPKSIGVFLFLSSICASVYEVLRSAVRFLHYKKVWTDRQSNYYRAPAFSMVGT